MGNEWVMGETQTAHTIESDAEFCRRRRRICRRKTPELHPPHRERLPPEYPGETEYYSWDYNHRKPLAPAAYSLL